jgi:hypothetical protein
MHAEQVEQQAAQRSMCAASAGSASAMCSGSSQFI